MQREDAHRKVFGGNVIYSLEVTDIRAFREKVIANGGEEFLDTDISVGLDLALQMWMHNPDGNKFEITEYTMDSMQITGR